MAGPLTGEEKRPLSPHLQVWRWHPTMAASIFHRASGGALYVGAVVLVAWLVALANGPAWFEPLNAFLLGPIGQTFLFLMTAALAYHLANGIRHLQWDAGAGLNPPTADMTAWLAIAFAAAAPIGVWALAYAF